MRILKNEAYDDTRAGAIMQSNGVKDFGALSCCPLSGCRGKAEIAYDVRAGGEKFIFIRCRKCGLRTEGRLLHWMADPTGEVKKLRESWENRAEE